MIHFTRYYPAYCTDFEKWEKDFNSLEDMLEYFGTWPEEMKDGGIWATDDGDNGDQGYALIVSSTKIKWWWVVGFVKGIDLSKRLPQFDEVYKGK